MTETIHLSPHDPIPQPGPHALVLRHFGEDDPNAIVVEIIFHGKNGGSTAAHHANGTAMTLEEAVASARTKAESLGLKRLYVLDRTAGLREQEVLHSHGDHSFQNDSLEDTDPEDGEKGSTILDRPHDAGYRR